ncbi:MAG: CoA transferase [Candidatus Thorarchaeota archaeon]
MLKTRFEEIIKASGLSLSNEIQPEITGEDPIISTKYPIGEVATTALGLTGLMAEDIWYRRSGIHQKIQINVRDSVATLLGFGFQKLHSHKFSRGQTHTVGLYKTADDRWIHIHGGLPHLKRGLLEILKCEDNRKSIKLAVNEWNGEDLEEEIAKYKFCGVLGRSKDEWANHPQGKALSKIPVVTISRIETSEPKALNTGNSPLDGVRVLDLTRILAGPCCGRTLASYGADVMRISSPHLPSIESFVIETSHGKRSSFIDLNTEKGRECLKNLIKDADVFVNGYRTGALESRGFGPKELAEINPNIIYASINCYGNVQPWIARKGWEQLAQTTTGIAYEQQKADGKPQLIQAAATDYTTGYLAAYGIMKAIIKRSEEGGSWHVKTSLCQTAMWLTHLGPTLDETKASGFGNINEILADIDTEWGRLTYLKPVVHLSETPPKWARPPAPLGFHEPKW